MLKMTNWDAYSLNICWTVRLKWDPSEVKGVSKWDFSSKVQKSTGGHSAAQMDRQILF